MACQDRHVYVHMWIEYNSNPPWKHACNQLWRFLSSLTALKCFESSLYMLCFVDAISQMNRRCYVLNKAHCAPETPDMAVPNLAEHY